MPEHQFDPFAPCAIYRHDIADAARQRQTQLTKPAGSLGQLEDVAVWLAGAQGKHAPSAERVAIILFAADHGVTAQGISAYPSSVTAQMLANFANGGAAISVLAGRLGAVLQIVDVGVDTEGAVEGVISEKIRRGTRDFSTEPAMTSDELVQALAAGARAVARIAQGNPHIVIFGDMGIGNSTSAAAVIAALTGKPARDVAGPGTGLDPAGVAHKATVIDTAIGKHGLRGGQVTAEQALEHVGGYEIAAMAGAMIAGAQRGIPVLVDGFIATAAALAAVKMNPSLCPLLVFGHRSAEPGHDIALAALDAKPLLDLGMRLGEGTGAAVALSVVRLACDLHNRMATFDEARVAEARKPL